MKTFEEVVRNMSAREIIMAMVNGLKNPHTKISMITFGHANLDKEGKVVCYGCAATNAICEIAKIEFTPETITNLETRSAVLNSTQVFLEVFENAIDCLRRGEVNAYNDIATWHGFALIDVPEERLPTLDTSAYQFNLKPYEKLAKAQGKKKKTLTSEK